MAFKMKNPSMAKLTKAAGDNRAAMKMKKEAAAKMKKESAMKKAHADKESMAKLMDKASAMKMKDKSPIKADIPEVEITADRVEKKPRKLFANKPTIKRMEGGVLGFTKSDGETVNLTAESIKSFLAPGLSNREKRMALSQLQAEGNKGREGGAATKMKKDSSMKMGHKSAAKMGHKSATKLKKPSPAKQKINMVKGPDGKPVPDFAVDGKGANDMKSATKMKPGKATGKAARQERKEGRKMARKLKKGLKARGKEMEDKTPGTGLKKKDSAVKMVKRVDPKVNKLKEMETRQPKPIPNKGRVKPLPKPKPIKFKPIKVKPIKAQKSPKVTARF